MNEHLIGVHINDQKAQLQKVLEEIRVENERLAKTFIQSAAAQKELDIVKDSLLTAQKGLAQTTAQLVNTKLEIEKAYPIASSIIAAAQDTASQIKEESDKRVEEASARFTVFQQAIRRAENIVTQLEGEILRAENDIVLRKATKESLSENIEILIESRNAEIAHYDEQILPLKNELITIKTLLDEALTQYELVKKQTENTFKNLSEREQKVKIAENDVEILRGRLVRLLVEKQKQLL